ncbi:MAG: hypothetical protein GY697_15980 [Desulfobacterales bacterium]|nr:hypothetical protein [Desulfobacterales bacterium]
MDTKGNKSCGQTHETIQGIVSARKCDCCGHHEIGIVRESGEYVPLKPGMVVAIIQPSSVPCTDKPG